MMVAHLCRRLSSRAVSAAFVATLMIGSGATIAQERTQPEPYLVPGPGMELTRHRCTVCHLATQFTRERRTLDEWRDTVQRKTRFDARISEDEIRLIVDYLFTYYGRNADGTPRARPEGAQVPVDHRGR